MPVRLKPYHLTSDCNHAFPVGELKDLSIDFNTYLAAAVRACPIQLWLPDSGSADEQLSRLTNKKVRCRASRIL